MSINNSSLEESKFLSKKSKPEKGAYTSFNSLTGKMEVKPVSQAMRDYISNGFAKLKPSTNK